jgi:hypothetical protein
VYQIELFDVPLLDEAVHEELISHDESVGISLILAIEDEIHFLQRGLFTRSGI